MDKFGIDKWQFIVGGSLGGMQALQWSLDYPDNVNNAIIIAASPKLTAQNIALMKLQDKQLLVIQIGVMVII